MNLTLNKGHMAWLCISLTEDHGSQINYKYVLRGRLHDDRLHGSTDTIQILILSVIFKRKQGLKLMLILFSENLLRI
jgi:hypothetical protein